jgi:hypothetical protein
MNVYVIMQQVNEYERASIQYAVTGAHFSDVESALTTYLQTQLHVRGEITWGYGFELYNDGVKPDDVWIDVAQVQ